VTGDGKCATRWRSTFAKLRQMTDRELHDAEATGGPSYGDRAVSTASWAVRL
jgi:hypothetical protein